MAGGLGHFLDRLHPGGAGADHRHPLALEAHRLMRPLGGVERLARERMHPFDAWHRRRRKRADGGGQEARAEAAAILQRHIPAPRRFLVVCRGDTAVELDVLAEVEFVGDVVQVAQRLRLAGEMLAPVPFLQQLLREGVCVGVAFRIEARPRIAVPVPGPAHAGTGLQHAHAHAQFAQAEQLIHPGHAGPDDQGVIVRSRGRTGGGSNVVRGGHTRFLLHGVSNSRAL